MTMSSQLWRTVLAASSLSADQQDAAPDEKGSYGELDDAIDEIVGEAASKSRRGRSRRNRDSKRSD